MREALYCIRCGACLNACPIYREIGGHAYVNVGGEGSPYPGPIGSVLSPALFGLEGYGHLARASTLCGACKEACPVDIDLPGLLLRVRAGQVTTSDQPTSKPNPPSILAFGLRVFTWMAVSHRRFALAQRLAGIFSRLIASDAWIRMPAVTGWGYSKDFPRPARHPFRDRFSSLQQSVNSQQSEVYTVSTQIVDDGTILRAMQASPMERFEAEIIALGGSFTHCSLPELPRLLLAFLQENMIDSVMAWEANALPEGILERIKIGGIGVNHDADASARAGMTGAIAAIAETGSLLLADAPGTPLTASLLPETHIVLLDSQDIYTSLDQVLSLPQAQSAPAAVLISGPSRTADIEMSLTIGVHGPGRMHVFCW